MTYSTTIKIDTIIFDVDGVLLDSYMLHYKAWKKLFDRINIPYNLEINAQKTSGQPRFHALKLMIPNLSESEALTLAEEKQSYFLQLIETENIQAINGAKEFLIWLKNHGYKTVAASSSKNAKRLLEKVKLDKYLDSIITGNDFVNPKPDPEIFLTACKKVGSTPGFCIVIEDATVGIEAANAGGFNSIGVLSSKDKLMTELADFCVVSVGQFSKIIKRYNL